jgi:hypothetical protein
MSNFGQLIREGLEEYHKRTADTAKPQGARGIDDANINAMVTEARGTIAHVRTVSEFVFSALARVVDKGLIVTPTIFGLKIPIHIHIPGTDAP